MTEPTLPNDRIELLQTFVRIVEGGSLSAAARRIGTTQPTVSRRLQALERLLGVKLIQRTTHAVNLTPDGEGCFERARTLVDDWARLQENVRGASQAPAGVLRVLVPHAFGQAKLIEPLANYLRDCPGMRVEWLLHDRRPDFVAEGLDCAIQVGQIDDPTVVAVPLFEVQRIVVGAPSVLAGAPPPAQPDALQGLPWLALHTYYRDRVVLHKGGDSAEIQIQPRLSTDSLYALRAAAIAGLGLAVVSAWMVEDELRDETLVQLVPRWQAPPLTAWLVYPYSRFYPARLRRFIDSVRAAPLPRGTRRPATKPAR